MTDDDDWLVVILHDHMRIAVEDSRFIKCWCDERFEGGTAHRQHVARIIREALNETKEGEREGVRMDSVVDPASDLRCRAAADPVVRRVGNP